MSSQCLELNADVEQQDLHTSGSTILIGRLCTFDDRRMPYESLLTSWNLCLQYLSHYNEVSSVAKKSSHLLKQSAKRLVSKNHQLTVSTENRLHSLSSIADKLQDFQSANVERFSFPAPKSLTETSCISEKKLLSRTNMPESPIERGAFYQSEVNSGLDFFPGVDLCAETLREFSDDEADGILSWPPIPYISQLETFPLYL